MKFCSYFPYTARLCINGNEYAKRQAAKAGIGFEALDNGFAAVADTEAVQAICDGLTEQRIDALLHKWLARIPHPYTPQDRAAGYRYAVSVLQAEFSLTQMLDQPVSGRVFFEQVIRDNLDLGRPDRVQADLRSSDPPRSQASDAKPIPHSGDHPARHAEPVCRLQAHHNQAVPQGRTSAADRDHDQRHLRLQHRQAADQSARPAKDRLLSQPTPPRRSTTQPRPRRWHHTLTAITEPVHTATGQRVAGMRFTDDRVQALFSVLCIFRLLPRGFTNRDLREHLEPLLGRAPGTFSSGQGTYDLRRLRHHGLIERIPHSHRYRVTTEGHRRTLFLSRTHHHLLRDGLAQITAHPISPQDSAPPTARTKQPSTTYSSVPGSPHEQDSNLTHPQRQTRLKSSTDTTQVI